MSWPSLNTLPQTSLLRPTGGSRKLDKTLGVIAKYPLMGEAVDHLAPGMRRHCFGNYLLFYVPIEGGIELRRVLHGARKIEDLF